MAQFDVCRLKGGAWVVDCQADLHRHLKTRLVVPLEQDVSSYPIKQWLNPLFDVDGTPVVLVTEFAATIPTSIIAGRIGSLDAHRDQIIRALDFLIGGN